MTYAVLKQDRRLYITKDGERVYALPFWLRSQLRDREELEGLAEAFNAKGGMDITSIIEFEARLRRRLQGEE